MSASPSEPVPSHRFTLNPVLGAALVVSLVTTAAAGHVIADQGDRNVNFSVIPSKTTFAPGETVEFLLRAENEGEETVTFRFGSSCRAFFHIERDGRRVYQSRFLTMCAQVMTTLQLAPRKQRDFPFRWNQVDSRGAALAAGDYLIVAYLANDNSPPVSASIRVE